MDYKDTGYTDSTGYRVRTPIEMIEILQMVAGVLAVLLIGAIAILVSIKGGEVATQHQYFTETRR